MSNDEVGPKKGRKRGPKASATPSLEQLTVRLNPKWRFGVELMSRANHQSLSETVEWAVKIAMHNVRVNSVGTLARLIDSVWGATDFELLWKVWRLEPNLLTFEERSVIRIVRQSHDLYIGAPLDDNPDFEFINKHYMALKILARASAELGVVDHRPLQRKVLGDILKKIELSNVADVEAASDVAKKALTPFIPMGREGVFLDNTDDDDIEEMPDF